MNLTAFLCIFYRSIYYASIYYFCSLLNDKGMRDMSFTERRLGEGSGKRQPHKWKSNMKAAMCFRRHVQTQQRFPPWPHLREFMRGSLNHLESLVCMCVCGRAAERQKLDVSEEKKRDWEKTHFEHCLCALWPVFGEYLGQPCCFKMDRQMNEKCTSNVPVCALCHFWVWQTWSLTPWINSRKFLNVQNECQNKS